MTQSKALKGKVAVITGAASTMGEAIARKFVDHGAKVILADVQLSKCETIVDDLVRLKKAEEGAVQAITCNVTNSSEIRNLIDKARRDFGRLDIFYNCVEADKDVSPTNLDIFKETMKINVESVLDIIHQASKAMMMNSASRKGCIICTGSTVGLLDGVVPSAYSISKTALIGVVRAAAAELGSRGVRVNAISPHLVAPRYDMSALKDVFPRVTHQRLDDMTKRLATEEDVANAAVYLASDDRVNGHNLVLNGQFPLIPSSL